MFANQAQLSKQDFSFLRAGFPESERRHLYVKFRCDRAARSIEVIFHFSGGAPKGMQILHKLRRSAGFRASQLQSGPIAHAIARERPLSSGTARQTGSAFHAAPKSSENGPCGRLVSSSQHSLIFLQRRFGNTLRHSRVCLIVGDIGIKQNRTEVPIAIHNPVDGLEL